MSLPRLLRRAARGGALAFVLALCGATAAHAQQFVYEPTNPAFGGSYLNYSWLMSSAQAQKTPEKRTTATTTRDPFADFQDSMQRQILSALSRELIYNRFSNLDLTKQGRFDLGDYLVEVIPGLNGTSIKILNRLTGDESVVTIPSL